MSFFSTSFLFGLIAIIFFKFAPEYWPKPSLDVNKLNFFVGGNGRIDNKIAVVTGGTSGLGKQIALDLAKLGAHVILVGRNSNKVDKIIQELKDSTDNNNNQKLNISKGIMDVSDLNSVKKFSEELITMLDDNKIDYLVNNAGIHYASAKHLMDKPSAQGYDLVFATNYLGHFLLTENLLPYMSSNGRIVQIASGMHIQTNGNMLNIHDNNMPEAARADIQTFTHHELSYGNSKLAQVLHARALQRDMNKRGYKGLKAISVCPGWVSTNILPKDIAGQFVAHNAYAPAVGVTSALTACFQPNLEGGEFIYNSWNFMAELPYGMTDRIFDVANALGPLFRQYLVVGLSMITLACQPFHYGAHVMPASRESYDETLQNNLYQWSTKVIADYKL